MRKGKYVVSGVLVAIALAAVAYWRYSPPAYAGADATLIATEEALSVPETILLGSLDIDYLDALRNKYFGKPTAPDLPALAQEPITTTEALRAAIDASGSASHASLALYRSSEGGLGKIVVLDGKFAPDNMTNALGKYAQVTPVPDQPNTWSVRFEDAESCKLSEPWTVQATNERVVAVAGEDEAMLARLRDKAKAGRDLTRWREFRRNRFAAIAVFLPDTLPDRDIDPMLSMSAQVAQKNLAGFESIYLGAAMKPLLPSGEIALWLAAKTPQAASEKARTWREKIAASRDEWATIMPTVAALHDHASIEARSNLVAANMQLDRRLAGELRQLPGEIFGLMFGGFGMKARGTQADMPEQEQIDKQPRAFLAKTSIAALPPFDAKAPFVDTPAATVGPFGIALTGIRLTGSEPRVLELELRASAAQLANVGDDAASMMAFSITSVQGPQRKELLRAERCGLDRNSAPGRPQHSMNEQLQATKTVRLVENAQQTDIASIKGNIRLRLATEIETVAFAHPKVGDRLERDGVRVELTQVSLGSIGYRASGAVDRLLHVRAKNARGEVLSRGSSMSSGDTAKSVQREFRGTIASIEWVVASAIEERDFPFELHDARLLAQNGWADKSDEPFHGYSKAELARDLAQTVKPNRFGTPFATTTAGPVLLDFDRIGSFGNLRLDLSLFMPPLKNLDGALSAAEIQLDALTLADGTVQRPAADASPWTSMVFLKRFGDDPYRGDASIDTGLEVKRQDLASVSGRVLLRVPRAMEITTVSAAEVAATTDTACGPVLLTEVSQRGLSIEGTGDPACIYAAHALGADDKEMQISDAKLETRPGAWVAKVSTNGTPSAIELVVGKEVERMEFSFEAAVGKR